MILLIIIFSVYLIFSFSLKLAQKRVRPVFSIDNESSSLSVYFSLVASKLKVQNFILIASIVALEGLQGLWFLASAFIGYGVVLYIFLPLWDQLKYDNENDLILDRFRTKWGNVLFHFRGLYVGILVNVTLISLSMLAFVKVISFFIAVEESYLILIIAAFNLLNSLRAGVNDKLISNRMNVLFVLGFIVFMMISGLMNAGGWSELHGSFDEIAAEKLSIFPSIKSQRFLIFLVYICVQWWSAQTFDGSGKVAQRIMGLGKRGKRILIASHLTEILVFVLIAFISLIGLSLSKDIDAELSFFGVLEEEQRSYLMKVALLLGLSGVYFLFTEAQMNWAGSLISSSMNKWCDLHLNRYLYIFLINILVVPVVFYFDAVIQILEFLLGISAGVAPIFLLRWFLPRINAQTQLAAMIGAIVLSVIFDILSNIFVESMNITGKHYTDKLIFVTFFTLVISMVTSVLSYSLKDKRSFIAFKKGLVYPDELPRKLIKALLYGLALCVLYISLLLLFTQVSI